MSGDPEQMIRIFVSMPSLACLYLQGNPIIGLLKNYRKRMVSEISTLTYLDDRPVFSLERVCAEAWANGGVMAERKARAEYKRSDEAKVRTNHSLLLSKREDARSKRVARVAQCKQAFRGAGSELGRWKEAHEVDVEPPDLTAARSELAQCHAPTAALHWEVRK